ncbi:MAG: hypothetical protein H6736_20900 [Alphaproteobacteria bacterium]|nr:hypothetical protein [Alphaproteobacteria bacterium]
MRALLVVALLAGCRNDTGFTNLVGGDGVLRFNLPPEANGRTGFARETR